MKIITGGHIDVPAEIQKRWGTHSVVFEDHGDHVLFRPTADEAGHAPDEDEHWHTDLAEGGRRASSGAGF
jgi:hypothetical protein